MQIFLSNKIFFGFIFYMQIYSNYLPNQPVSDSPSFGAAKDITLKYVVSKYPHILPERVFEAAKNIINTIPKNKRPTLYDLHLEQYKGLLECRTLNEARNLYPEFREVLDASIFRNSRSKHLKNLKVSLEDLSLRVLQDYYGRLIPQHEIGTELGFVSKSAFDWFKDKIRFLPFKKNYLTLVYSSDEAKNAVIAAKTRAYNQKFPQQMYEHNRQAAQSNKSAEYRKIQSQRIKQYDTENPERRKKIGRFTKEVWSRLPHIRKAISKEMSHFPGMDSIINKRLNHEPYTEQEKRLNKGFFNFFWRKYPDYKEEYTLMTRTVSKEWKNKN